MATEIHAELHAERCADVSLPWDFRGWGVTWSSNRRFGAIGGSVWNGALVGVEHQDLAKAKTLDS